MSCTIFITNSTPNHHKTQTTYHILSHTVSLITSHIRSSHSSQTPINSYKDQFIVHIGQIMNNFQPQVHDYAMEGTAIVSGSDIYDHENDDSDSSSFSSTEGNNYANNNNASNNSNNMHNNLDNLAQIKEHAMSEDDANDNDNDSHYDEEDEDMNEDGAQNTRKYKIPKIDPLYNPNGDDEDEAYVYKNLRGGLEEKVSIRATNRDQNDNTKNTNSNSTSTSTSCNENTNSNTKTSAQIQAQAQSQSQQQKQQQQAFSLEQAKILKPRNSDGVLSCPCCFQIVCMDCQKHEKYLNQYRAMFVMNIGVDWNVTVTPEHVGKREKEEQVQYGEGQSSNKRIKGNSSNGYDIDLNINRTNSGTNNGRNSSANSGTNNGTNNGTNSGANNNMLKPIQVPTDEEHRIHENNLKNDKAEVYYSVYCTGCRTQVAALDMTDEIYYFFGCIVSG
jgi:hypothetical protein